MSRVANLTSALPEYDRSNELKFRGDVQRSLTFLQQRIDVLYAAKWDEIARATIRRKFSTPTIGVVTNGGGEGWGY